jgi:protein-S-isoprenylcysteine O-methyltransferase Ste14
MYNAMVQDARMEILAWMEIPVYTAIAYSSWLVLWLVWLPGYFTSKRTVDRPERGKQLVALFYIYAGFALIFSHGGFGSFLGIRVTPEMHLLGQIGLGLDLVGILFAIWARWALGRNWSNVMALKEKHELVQTGPYGIVRHPIYTGMLLGVLGTAMTTGLLASYLGFICMLIGLLIRTQSEDRLMAKQFPETHPSYRQRTKKLIPLIW